MTDDYNANLAKQTPYEANSASCGRSIGDKPPRDASVSVPAPWQATHAHPTMVEMRVGQFEAKPARPQTRPQPIGSADWSLD